MDMLEDGPNSVFMRTLTPSFYIKQDPIADFPCRAFHPWQLKLACGLTNANAFIDKITTIPVAVCFCYHLQHNAPTGEANER